MFNNTSREKPSKKRMEGATSCELARLFVYKQHLLKGSHACHFM